MLDPAKVRDSFQRLYDRAPLNDQEYRLYCVALRLRVDVLKGEITRQSAFTQLEKCELTKAHYLEIVKREFEKGHKDQRPCEHLPG